MRQLLKAGVHFGHHTRRWDPRMSPYLYGARNKVHIINLEKTLPMFRRALREVRDTVSRGGRVLFVGTKRQVQGQIKDCAIKSGQFYVNHRWLGGMLTNWNTVSESISRLKAYETQLEEGATGMTKKERLNLERSIQKLELNLGGIKEMAGLPSILVVIDVRKEAIAVTEARKLGIPVVGIVDSNSNPELIDFAVPGNDDAIRAISLYCDLFSAAVLDGLQQEASASGVDLGASENPLEDNLIDSVSDTATPEEESSDESASTSDVETVEPDVSENNNG